VKQIYMMLVKSGSKCKRFSSLFVYDREVISPPNFRSLQDGDDPQFKTMHLRPGSEGGNGTRCCCRLLFCARLRPALKPGLVATVKPAAARAFRTGTLGRLRSNNRTN
jgi:hypothetical protein